MRLDPLYHWAPMERRQGILTTGLTPYRQPVVHTGGGDADARFGYPYVCLGTTPSVAWGLSGGSRDGLVDEFEGWDLWQVRLKADADVHVLPMWGWEVQEVRVRTAILADSVWWVGTRTSWAVSEPVA